MGAISRSVIYQILICLLKNHYFLRSQEFTSNIYPGSLFIVQLGNTGLEQFVTNTLSLRNIDRPSKLIQAFNNPYRELLMELAMATSNEAFAKFTIHPVLPW